MSTTFAERVVSRLTRDRTQPDPSGGSRRGFIAKATLAGTALAVAPWKYLTQPVSAYDAICGAENECADGWSVFCCTINAGANKCPPGSFIAGWWKADNSGFCCGGARYYIDCNETCGTTDQNWTCHCNSSTCDRRRVACNQFRYGQCNTHISCYGPVVCRLVSCTPPWTMEGFNCSTSSATDNATGTHSAPCLPGQCPSAITRLYTDLGGTGSVLGKRTRAEGAHPSGGTYALYERGGIFSYSLSGTHEVHGPIWTRYAQLGEARSKYLHPVTNELAVGDGKGRYNRFRSGGIIWSSATGAHDVPGAIFTYYWGVGGPRGSYGYPVSGEKAVGDSKGQFVEFQQGNIYWVRSIGARGVRGTHRTKFLALGGPRGSLRYPTTNTRHVGADNRGRRTDFQSGVILNHELLPTCAIPSGPLLTKYFAIGGYDGSLGYPKTDQYTSGAVLRVDFQRGYITHNPTTGEVVVHQ